MEIFLDSFNYEGIKKYLPYLTGITTNPTIISTECSDRIDFQTKLKALSELGEEFLINLQVQAKDAAGMIEDAKKIIEYGPNFIVKIPLNFEGLKALKEIKKLGCRTNGTLCFSLFQAKVAQDYGCDYISPFIGRMEDNGEDIEEFMYSMRNILTYSNILAASIRNAHHLELALKAEADAITLSEKVLDQVFELPILVKGVELFDQANEKFKIV